MVQPTDVSKSKHRAAAARPGGPMLRGEGLKSLAPPTVETTLEPTRTFFIGAAEKRGRSDYMPTNSSRRGRGRPGYSPTDADRRKVSIAAGGGVRHLDIAFALGISRETLEQHYQSELAQGAIARRIEVLQALYTAAKKGSASAAKAYLLAEPQMAAPPLGEAATLPAVAPARVEPVGKKEAQQQAAGVAQAGTDWENDLPRHGAPHSTLQ